jgi:hypothetical protein
MFSPRSHRLAGSAIAACIGVLAAAGAASAAQTNTTFAPNYMFANGYMGFSLESHGGPINPGVLVGFNPQPDPPGDGDNGALIALLNPSDPELFNPSTGGAFTFTLALEGLGDGSVIPLPDAPGDGHHTSYRGVIDGHSVDIMLDFGPGSVLPGSWASFNPQPEPPGDVMGGAFNFAPGVDPIMTFAISIDGDPLSFTVAPGVPEPQAWALMLLGFGGAGAALRARRRQRAVAAAA